MARASSYGHSQFCSETIRPIREGVGEERNYITAARQEFIWNPFLLHYIRAEVFIGKHITPVMWARTNTRAKRHGLVRHDLVRHDAGSNFGLALFAVLG